MERVKEEEMFRSVLNDLDMLYWRQLMQDECQMNVVEQVQEDLCSMQKILREENDLNRRNHRDLVKDMEMICKPISVLGDDI